MARVFVENLSKVFDGQVAAVDGLTLDVADRELMVIVGPSGCGKTTTLRMIAGLEEPTSGTITIDDRVVNCLAPKDRDIAMVFQNYALYPHMTVFGNMAFGLKMRKFAKADIKKRVKKAATLLEIEHLFNRKPNELSGGQRQRVAVGRAIVREPKVFLFDEPLSNLDARMRLTARAELKSLHHKLKTTTIYVTHDQQEAMTLGDRICVMYNGQVQQVGSPIDVYNKPANRFVAGFLGAPPMNFFTGKVEADANTLRFRIGEDMVELPLRLRTKMADHHDMKMVLGIRPENMSFSNFTGQDKNTISATVGVVEPLGIKTDIYLTDRTGTKFIINTAPSAVPSVGDLVKVHIDLEKIHLFEQGETGRNVTLF